MNEHETSEVNSSKPSLFFIFLNHQHHKSVSERLNPYLKDRNILFIEAPAINQTTAARQETEQTLNLILALPASLTDEQRNTQSRVIDYHSDSENFVTLIAISHARTGKRLFFVDIDDTHPHFYRFSESASLFEEMIEKCKMGLLDQAEVIHQKYIENLAILHEARETEVQKQVCKITQALQREGACVNGAVIQGIVHQPTAANLPPENYQLESICLDEIFSYEVQLWLKKRQRQEIKTTDSQRAMLELILLEYYDSTLELNIEGDRHICNLLAKLDDAQIEALLNRFKLLYKLSMREITHSKRPLTLEQLADFGPYIFHQTTHTLLADLTLWT